MMVSVLEGIAGFSSGLIIGSAMAAFFAALGLYSKVMRGLTVTQRSIGAAASLLGVTLGALLYFFKWNIGGGRALEIAFGLFSGAFLGIYIALIAEVLEYVPFLRRMGVPRTLVCACLLAFSLGKAAGWLYYGLVY